MKIHESEGAVKFDTKGECQEWINARIVRFKLKVQHGQDKDGKFAVGPLTKAGGKIHLTAAEDYKVTSLDEPLSNYAFPKREDEMWLAVMAMR